MDAKQEDVIGVIGSMIDGCYPDPQSILKMLATSEKEEAVLYTQIAQAVPSEELRKIILYKAKRELRMAEKLAMLSQCFGAIPAASPVGTMPYSAGEEKEKK